MHHRSNPLRMLPLGALVFSFLIPSTPTPTPDGEPATAVEQPGETSTPTATLSEDTATVVGQPGEISTPTPESGSEATVELQFVSPSGELPAGASAAAAQPAAADLVISPNEDGWPDFNPLIMELTLTCPPGRPPCTNPLTVRIYSNDGGRFWLYSTPNEPDCGCAEVVVENGPYSLRSYSGFSNGVFVPSGTQRKLYWALWIQPSPASTIFVEATYGGTNQFEIAMEQMRVRPLVFIPGILGTMPPTFAAEGAMDPILGIYDPLLIHLQKTGYELNQSLFPMPVDWRASIVVAADELANSIPGFLQTANQLGYVGEPASGWPATKVDLVVHSMGGLITRTYVEGGNYQDNVGKVIFIASPHRGFPEAYRTWEGLTWDSFLYEGYQAALGIAMDELLWPTMIGKRYGPSEEEKQIAGCGSGPNWKLPYIFCSTEALSNWSHDPSLGALSLLEMLPDDTAEPYLLCDVLPGAGCDPLSEYPFGREPNPLLDGPDGLNADYRLQALADRLGGPENIYVIFGSGTTTDQGYFVRHAEPPLWAHGEPAISIPTDGDDLIPTYSANLSLLMPDIPAQNVVELTGPAARHKEIVFNPHLMMWDVPGFLTGTAGFAPEEYSPNPIPVTLDLLVFVANCPVNLTVTDPLGRRVGFDPATGGSLFEVEGAIYAASGAEGQFIIMPNSELGKYQFDGVAFGDAEFVLSAYRLGPDGLTTLGIMSGNVVVGDEVGLEVDPSQEITPTPTDTPIVTDTPTPTDTPTFTPTDTPSPTPTNTFTPSPTATRTPRPTRTPTPVGTGSLLQAIDRLRERIQDYEEDEKMSERLERSLLAKVRSARYYIQHGREQAAAHKLESLVHQIRAQSGKQITRAAAADLMHRANALIDRLTDDDDDDDDRDDD